MIQQVHQAPPTRGDLRGKGALPGKPRYLCDEPSAANSAASPKGWEPRQSRKFFIANVTVRNHVHSILHKQLHVHTKVAAVVLAYRHSLV